MATRQEIEQIVVKYFKGDTAQKLIDHLQPCIMVRFGQQDQIEIGKSKLGGAPDLPEGMEYPVKNGEWCEFLCQINLEELKDFDLNAELPHHGLLSIFVQCFKDKGDDIYPFEAYPQTKDEFFCLFFHSMEGLRRVSVPDELRSTLLVDKRISFDQFWSMPSMYDAVAPMPDLDADVEVEMIREIGALHGLRPYCSPDCQILGYSVDIGETELHYWKLFYHELSFWEASKEGAFKEILSKELRFRPFFQMTVRDTLFERFHEDGAFGHLSLGILEDDLEKGDLQNLVVSIAHS